jgi:plasmid maintenance system antidote protein VapI
MNRNQSVKGKEVLHRLNYVLNQSGLSARKFAERIGLKAESATRLFNGITGLTKPLAYSIELHFKFSAIWLLTGLDSKGESLLGKLDNPLDRLLWVRQSANLNQKAFAESVGLTASGLNNIYTRKSRVSKVLANSVELKHGINADWLLTGKGERYVSDKEIDDQANIRRLRCLKCNGLGYTTKKQTHPREGLIKVREQCDCIASTLPIPEIKDGRLIFKMGQDD